MKKTEELLDSVITFIVKFRYILVILAIIIGCILSINGSSIANFASIMNSPNWGLKSGIPRIVRVDEWASFTPMALSQAFGEHPYSLISNIIRGDATDVFVVYGQPVLDFFGMLFRPFLNGFILLGSERGLSFYWVSRFLCLFLVWFELFYRVVTKNNKITSVIGAFMVSFSPMIMWWFSTNGLVEMLIFGPLFLIMLDVYLRTKEKRIRIACLIVAYICAGGYFLCFYPASMIPLAYLFALLAIFIIAKNTGDVVFKKSDLLGVLITTLALSLSIAFILFRSRQTIALVTGTVYPGGAVSTGGGGIRQLFWSWGNLFFPYYVEGLETNASEQALMFSLAPMGMLIVILGMIKEKKRDLLSILMIVLSLAFTWYCAFGIPQILAKITLLSHTHPHRAIIVPGISQIIMLCYGLDKYKNQLEKMGMGLIGIIALVYSVFSVLLERFSYNTGELHYLTGKLSVIILILAFVAVVSVFLYPKYKYITLVVLCAISVAMGIRVNPIQHGLGSIQNDELSRAVQDISQNDPEGLWVVANLPHEYTNYPIMQGARTLNSIQTHPNLEVWRKLDPNGENEFIYNRYAHVIVNIVPDNYTGSIFELIQADLFVVNVTTSQLKNDLGVKYVFTQTNPAEYSTNEIGYRLRINEQGFQTYEIIDVEPSNDDKKGESIAKVPENNDIISGMDYLHVGNWVVYDGLGDKPVDTFLLAPTSDSGEKGNKLIDISMDAGTPWVAGLNERINQLRGIYDQNTNIFAPRYRQVTYSVYTMSDKYEAQMYFDEAYADVKKAFYTFLSQRPEDKPIIIAGFSQGSHMALRLMKEAFADESLRNRLVAAYLIGWRITDEDLRQAPYLKMATGELDTGVIISYNSEAEYIIGSTMVPNGTNTHSINPLNWSTGSEVADASLNLGACFPNNMGEIETEIPALTGCYIDSKRGTLKCTGVNLEQYSSDGIYHDCDCKFFYRNLQKNVMDRIACYQGMY